MTTHQMTRADLADLMPSWRLHLLSGRKSPETIKSYQRGVTAYLAWCARQGVTAPLRRAHLAGFTAALLGDGLEPATARARQLGVRRYVAWLAEEGEISADPFLGVKPPKLDSKVIPVLGDAQTAALLKACAGKQFRDRRDEAIVRLMLETGARSAEVLGMRLEDLDLAAGTAVIRRGKGGRGRAVYIGPKTAAAIDRYLRARRTHRLAATPVLWLGDRGKQFGYHALRDTLQWRGRMAGLPDGFSPHKLRHTAASRWLDAGGSEGGLMAMAGWSRRDMIDRYTRATSERRAAEEARRLGLGERL